MNLYYAQVNILCLLLLAIVAAMLSLGNNVRPTSRRAFAMLVASAMLICASDIFAWVFLGSEAPGSVFLVWLSNTVYYMSITVSAYAWLVYVELRTFELNHDFTRFRRFSAIPMLLMAALLVLNFFTGFIFTVDENAMYQRADGIILHWIVSWGYLIFATVEVLRKMLRSASRVEKRRDLMMLGFIVPPAVAAVLQMVFYGITSMQCGMTVSIVIIAAQFIAQEVSKDSLTGLNNRGALEGFLIERLQKGPAGMTILMCDVDNFKAINDTYGHPGGDVVLKRMADSLKEVCADYSRRLFLCRFGGDEFVISGPMISSDELTRLCDSIERKIATLNDGASTGPTFGISIGHASGVCVSYDDVERLIADSDKAMYAVKAAHMATIR